MNWNVLCVSVFSESFAIVPRRVFVVIEFLVFAAWCVNGMARLRG
jgi:hypothetical protein